MATITKNEILEATQMLKKYQEGKTSVNERIQKNEEYYNIRGYQYITDKNYNKDNIKSQSAWLFNSIANKHADFMDNFPMANILPREKGDKEEAEILTSIIPCILKANHFKKTYDDICLDKLKSGTGVYGIFWDGLKDNGIGDISIQSVDVYNLAWQPGIKNIQESRNIFYYRAEDTDLLKQIYPEQLANLAAGTDIKIPEYLSDSNIDKTNKSIVVDWYYKKEGKLHLCKYVGEYIIYSSENDPELAGKGIYDHGKYPFVFDRLYKIANSPVGFGQIDVMRNPQDWIDIINQQIMVNSKCTARPRYMIREDSSINKDDFADLSKDIISVTGNDLSESTIRQIEAPTLPSYVIQVLDRKVDELKETSGNRDWSQGGTSSGVTAASAIAALQEAGSKLSRDMIQGSYGAYEEVINFVIELIRQYYTDDRTFRIVGRDGQEDFVKYNNAGLNPEPQIIGGDQYYRKPVFDLEISASKASTFSRVAQNEFAKELYGIGLFNPDMADQALMVLDMMQFDGKETVIQKVSKNSKIPMMIQDILAMGMALQEATKRSDILPTLIQRYGLEEEIQTMIPQTQSRSFIQNPLGAAYSGAYENSLVDKAKERAQSVAQPK